MYFLEKLLPLVLGHFVADFALQTDTVAINKCPNNNSEININWSWWMTGHVSLHGLIVFFITGNSYLAFAEAIIHFYIDYLKCICLLYTSPSPRDQRGSRMPGCG